MTPNETPAQESQGWRPEEGDVLKGEVVAVSRAWSEWTNLWYPLVTIHDETRDEDVDVHAFHATLQSRLMETKPKVGDKLEVSYIGKRATKDRKREVAIYRVNVPGATGAEVWDSLERQAPANAQAGTQGTLPETADEDIPF